MPTHADRRVLVGRETFDDAGVFVLRDDLALVQTVDFFAPIVDDPYTFGQIAAANALSDVFAMGGEPLTALAIVGFPVGTLPPSVLTEILRGAQDKVREAGAVLIGGHSIIDEELKFGLSVTGQAHPARLLTNATARPGDRLVLTKPLGTGLLATAEKQGKLSSNAMLVAAHDDERIERGGESRRARARRHLRHGCHGLRTARPRPECRARQWRDAEHRREEASRASGRTGALESRHAHRRRGAKRDVPLGVTWIRLAPIPRIWRWRSIRRRPAVFCWPSRRGRLRTIFPPSRKPSRSAWSRPPGTSRSDLGDRWEWMGPGGFRRLQNDCDPTMSGLVGSIPMHSRHHRPDRVTRPSSSGFTRIALPRHAAALATIVVMVLAAARPLHAQRADSARAGVRRTAGDSTRATQIPKPPLSPRRAFLYSLALPGYSQSVLGRPTAGALFVLTESIALVMLRESAADLRQAKRFLTDSLVVIGYEPTGTPILQVSAYNERLVDIRRGHVEDWIAFLLANHLFAAADGYVGAHLWDLPTQISIEPRGDGAVLAAKVRW